MTHAPPRSSLSIYSENVNTDLMTNSSTTGSGAKGG